MGRSAWNTYLSAGTNHTATTSYAQSGTYSLEVSDINTNSIEVWSTSETDAPADARVESKMKNPDTLRKAVMNVFFRVQDANNFYFVTTYQEDLNAQNVYWEFGKVVAGTSSVITREQAAGSDIGWIDQTWCDVRCHGWTDGAGDFRVRYESDTDGDGTWTTRLETADPANDLSTGGGVGVGAYNYTNSYNTDTYYLDQTEVYY